MSFFEPVIFPVHQDAGCDMLVSEHQPPLQWPLTPLGPRSILRLNARKTSMSPETRVNNAFQKDGPRFDSFAPPSPPETPTACRMPFLAEQENAPPIFQPVTAETTRLDWRRPNRPQREQANPLLRNAEARRSRKREEFFKDTQRKREERTLSKRADSILHTDAVTIWRAWQQEQACLAPMLMDEDDELDLSAQHDDMEQEFSSVDRTIDQDGSNNYDGEDAALDQLLDSQQRDLASLVEMHEEGHPQSISSSELPTLQDRYRWRESADLPASSHFGSDDDDFERALMEVVENELMDTSC